MYDKKEKILTSKLNAHVEKKSYFTIKTMHEYFGMQNENI